jgi:hypothetical protein
VARSKEMLEALEIPVPEDPSLVLDGCRRLLGPNLYGTETGAVGDAVVTDTAPERVLALWSKYLQTLLDAMGWAESSLVGRTYQGGCNLYVSASVDQLYTAAYVIEAAWYFCTSELLSLPSRPVADMVDDLVRVAEQEANAPFRRWPRLLPRVASIACSTMTSSPLAMAQVLRRGAPSPFHSRLTGASCTTFRWRSSPAPTARPPPPA